MNIEEALQAIAKLGEDQGELKSGLTTLVKTLNQEKGTAKSDIIRVKAERDGLKSKVLASEETSTQYKDLMKILSEAGVDSKNSQELAKKLNVDKTHDDEVGEYKRLLKDSDSKLKAFEDLEHTRKFEIKLNPILDEAIKKFKDKDGNDYKLVDKFIDRKELYKPIDLDSEPLVNDRLKQVLTNAHSEQENFIKETGMTLNRETHNVITDGDRHFSGNQGIITEELYKQAAASGGSIESISKGIAAMRAANAKTKGK